MAAICASRSLASIFQHCPQQRRDAVDMQAIFTDMAPAVDCAIDWARGQLSGADPVEVSVDRAQARQRRRAERATEVLPVALGSAEEAADAFTGAGLDVFDAIPTQFVAAKFPPEPEQYR